MGAIITLFNVCLSKGFVDTCYHINPESHHLPKSRHDIALRIGHTPA